MYGKDYEQQSEQRCHSNHHGLQLSRRLLAFATGLTALYLVLLTIAWLAMSGKWD